MSDIAFLLSTDGVKRQIVAARPALVLTKLREWSEADSGRIAVEDVEGWQVYINVGPNYVSVNAYKNSQNFICGCIQPEVNAQILADIDEALALAA